MEKGVSLALKKGACRRNSRVDATEELALIGDDGVTRNSRARRLEHNYTPVGRIRDPTVKSKAVSARTMERE